MAARRHQVPYDAEARSLSGLDRARAQVDVVETQQLADGAVIERTQATEGDPAASDG